MNILVRGAYGETNFGDDLLMLVFEHFFIQEFEGSEIVFLGEDNKYPSQLLVKSRYNEKIRPDMIVYGGGTQFFSFKENEELSTIRSKISKILMNPKIIFRFFRDMIRFSLRSSRTAPSAFLGFGLGPFKNESSKLFARESMKNAFFIGVRDQVSFDYCLEWGIKPVLGADVVFSSYFSIPQFKKTVNVRKKIGVIVRDWEWEESGASYIEILKKFVVDNDKELDYQFIVFAPHVDKQWMLHSNSEEYLIWDPKIDSVESFLETLNSFDGFISARYHGAIIAALLGKPAICVEIEPKLSILCSQVKEFKLWEKPFDPIILGKLVTSLDYRVNFSGSLAERKLVANSMLRIFKEQIIKSKPTFNIG